MKNYTRKTFSLALVLCAAFVLWTVAVRLVDVRAIGPDGTSVGFAAMNRFVHDLIGVRWKLYILTDWLSLIPLAIVVGFAVLGLVQWIQRKHLLKVDHSLLTLGGFYIITLAMYLLFETIVINYRPVLIDGVAEASYPSSTTMLVLCVMSTALLQCRERIKHRLLRHSVITAIVIFTVFMVIGRFASGVHWCSDILGGILLSAGLVLLYRGFCQRQPT